MGHPTSDFLTGRLERVAGESCRSDAQRHPLKGFGRLALVGAAALAVSGARHAEGGNREKSQIALVVAREGSASAQKGDKAPEGTDPKMTSDDPAYGYSHDKAIKVGPKEASGDKVADALAGAVASRAYLDGLMDESGKHVQFKRIGSYGPAPDNHLVDKYQLTTSTGKEIAIFIDMYHPKSDPGDQLAPKGLFKAKK